MPFDLRAASLSARGYLMILRLITNTSGLAGLGALILVSIGCGGDSAASDGDDEGIVDAESGSDDQGMRFDVGGDEDLPGGACPDGGPGGGALYEFTYIWIANTEEGTVSKIDTETGVEEARYRTSAGLFSPSRTTVNQFGDVLVANRGHQGSVTKIAARIDNCVESNGMPGIQTSTGPDDVLDWGEDECVLFNRAIPSGHHSRGPRGVAWEGGDFDEETCEFEVPDPRVWVGWGSTEYTVWRLDGESGEMLDEVVIPNTGEGLAYGGAVNGEGDFWLSGRAEPSLVVHIDGDTLEYTRYEVPGGHPYGITVDAQGNPWIATYDPEAADHVFKLDVESGEFLEAGGGEGTYRGMAIDREGQAWIAGNSPCRLSLVDVGDVSVIDDTIELPGCLEPVGVSIDRDGFVWVVDKDLGTAFKVDPQTRQPVLEVAGLAKPYTYSDMTGAGLGLVTEPPPNEG